RSSCLAASGMEMGWLASPAVTRMASRSTYISSAGFASQRAIRSATAAAAAVTQGMPSARQLPAKISANDSPPIALVPRARPPRQYRLGGGLARRAAAEVAIDEQDARRPEARVVERVQLPGGLRLGTVVLERGGAQPLEDDAAEEPGGDDAIGVDVVAADRDGRAAAAHALGLLHDQAPSVSMPKSSRASVTSPAIAAAATMTGDMRSVRPVGEPWRPLKLRLDDEAHSCVPSSLSGFIARHMEQPASRKSKPASRNTRSHPRRTISSRTRCDPGTTSAFTCGATWKLRPRMRRTTSSRSERRPLVHDPMKATSIFVPRIGLPGSRCM